MTALTNPPLIVTDLPTSVEYIQAGPVAGQLFTPARYYGTDVDWTRPYSLVPGVDGTQFFCLDTTPDGFNFPGHARGVIGVFGTASPVNGGATDLRIAVHKPTHNISDYQTGWTVLDGADQGYTGAHESATFGYAAIASQRLGDYSYVFLQGNSSPIFSDSTQIVNIHKVTRGEFIERGPHSGAGTLNGNALGDSLLDARGNFFISDDLLPFVWNVAQQTSFDYRGGSATIPPIAVTGFRDDGNHNVGTQLRSNNPSTDVTTLVLQGQAGAYYQLYDMPKGKFGVGPYLVFPWSKGDYNPPELWFLLVDMANEQTTGRISIYRSKWKKGAYRTLPTSTSQAFVVENPELNPHGYAFDHNWYKPENLVSRIGPFPNAQFHNPVGNAMALYQNTQLIPPAEAISGGNVAFSIQRDKTTRNVLHLFMQTHPSSMPSDTAANGFSGAWYMNSVDDGKTWSRPKQLQPYALPTAEDKTVLTYDGSSGGPATYTQGRINTKSGLLKTVTLRISDSTFPNMPVVRTNEGMMLMGGVDTFTSYTKSNGSALTLKETPRDAGYRAALVAIDYSGEGFGEGAKQTDVFRRGVTRGEAAWL